MWGHLGELRVVGHCVINSQTEKEVTGNTHFGTVCRNDFVSEFVGFTLVSGQYIGPV